ncbi:MAG: hypothetical protein ABL957_02855 [Parvularculaceae bacterium]
MAPWLKGLIICVYAVMSAGGLALMKGAAKPASPEYVAGFGVYGAAFCLWLFVILPNFPLSVAFPVSAGAIVLATLVLGQTFLSEPATPAKILGAILIVAGIAAIFVGPSLGKGGQP